MGWFVVGEAPRGVGAQNGSHLVFRLFQLTAKNVDLSVLQEHGFVEILNHFLQVHYDDLQLLKAVIERGLLVRCRHAVLATCSE